MILLSTPVPAAAWPPSRLDTCGRAYRSHSPPGTDASCGLYLASCKCHNVRNGTFKSTATTCCRACTEIELRQAPRRRFETASPAAGQAGAGSRGDAARHSRGRARRVRAEWPVGREDRRDRGPHPCQQAHDLLLLRRQGRPVSARAGERLPHRARRRIRPRRRALATHRGVAAAGRVHLRPPPPARGIHPHGDDREHPPRRISRPLAGDPSAECVGDCHDLARLSPRRRVGRFPRRTRAGGTALASQCAVLLQRLQPGDVLEDLRPQFRGPQSLGRPQAECRRDGGAVRRAVRGPAPGLMAPRMKTSIATVSISGTFPDKLEAIAAAGFDGIEIFETDFLTFGTTPRELGKMIRDSGLEITLFQPFRDFEGLPEPLRSRAFERARRKFEVMKELGTDLMLICSNVSPEALGGVDRAAADLRELGEVAAPMGIRVGYEALAWGRHVNDHRDAWEIVRRADHPNVGLILDSFHTLVRRIDPDTIRAIPGDRIFIVQLADAPRIDMDLLYLSRHFRSMPGEGDLPVVDFVRAAT